MDNSLVLRTEKRIYERMWLTASVRSAVRFNKSLKVSVKAKAKQTERCILAERETGSFVSLQSSRISQQLTSALLHTTLLLVFNISCVVFKSLRPTITTISFLKSIFIVIPCFCQLSVTNLQRLYYFKDLEFGNSKMNGLSNTDKIFLIQPMIE